MTLAQAAFEALTLRLVCGELLRERDEARAAAAVLERQLLLAQEARREALDDRFAGEDRLESWKRECARLRGELTEARKSPQRAQERAAGRDARCAACTAVQGPQEGTP